MTPADYHRFRAVMAGMAEVYQRELSTVLLDTYWLALADWPLADFERAAAHLLRTSEFLPRPAAFSALRAAQRKTAGEAFEQALAACPRYRYGTPSVDPVTDAVVRQLGGWEYLAMHDIATLHFVERRFADLYADMVEAHEVRAALPQLGSDAIAEIAAPARRLMGVGRQP